MGSHVNFSLAAFSARSWSRDLAPEMYSEFLVEASVFKYIDALRDVLLLSSRVLVDDCHDICDLYIEY